MRRTATTKLLLVAMIALLTAAFLSACGGGRSYEVTIPAGTWQSKDPGVLDDLPGTVAPDGSRTLVFHKGDQLRVVNLDEVDHAIGLVTVRAGETITYTFNQIGEFEGACTLLAGERITVEVT